MRRLILMYLCFISIQISAQQIDNLILKCEEFHLSGQTDSLKKYANLALSKSDNLLDPSSISKIQYFNTNTFVRSNPDSALQIFKDLAKNFAQKNNLIYVAYANSSMGSCSRRMGNFKEAIKFHNKAIALAKEHYGNSESIKLNRFVALQHNNLAVINFDMSDYELSNQNALTASKIGNQYNFKQIELASLIILANIQMHFKHLDLAEKSFLNAKNLAKAIDDKFRFGVALANLGIINYLKVDSTLKDNKAYIASKKYFNEALVLAKSQKDYTAISARYSNLANLENIVKNYQSANLYLRQALIYANLSKSKLLSMQLTTSLARNYLALNDTKRAIEFANEAIRMSKEMSNEKDLPNLYNILEKAYTIEKDFVKALEFQKAQMSVKDSLYQSSSTAKISELQTKYETEKKERAIELLTLQNAKKASEIKQKNYLILASIVGIFSLFAIFYFWNRQRKLSAKKEAAEMKQRLLRAQLNPHFLFNSLNSIQRLYVEGKTDLANDFISDFAQLMRDILEKTGKTTISVLEEMEFIEAYLSLEKRRMGDKFDFEILVSEEVQYGDWPIPSFIVQPLAENALLHGILPKNQKGKISITLDIENGNLLVIKVIDDGIGYYQSGKKLEHNSKGIDLIKNRLGKNGSIFIKEIQDKENILGTEIILQIRY